MATKIEVCNLALASIGADSIRTFDENNKRSRMCSVFYDFTVEYLLSEFDWPFARKLTKLNEAVIEDVIPEGQYVYQLPADCKTPRDLYPRGSEDWWEIMQDRLYCLLPPGDVFLYYTATNIDITKFSTTFVNLLSLGMAVRLSPPISQDKKITNDIYRQFNMERQNVWEENANIGNDYPSHDNNPENDPFVNPDKGIIYEGNIK